MPRPSLPFLLALGLPSALLSILLLRRESPVDASETSVVPNDQLPRAASAPRSRTPTGRLEELLDHPEARGPLRSAIANAVALAAPAPRAARFLTERGAHDLEAALPLLGARPGGTEALRERYVDLLGSDAGSTRERARVVAGLVDLPGEELLTIGLEDPSPAVRARAWTSLSLSTTFRPSATTLACLSANYERRDAAEDGLTGHATLHALAAWTPFVLASLPDLLPELRGLAQTIAVARDTHTGDRACARRLARTLPSPSSRAAPRPSLLFPTRCRSSP